MMFNNLPLEVIFNITTFLPFSDKLTMSLTCKKLQALIWNYTLFQDLTLNGTSERVEHVFKKFKDKKINGCQVKQLTIALNDVPSKVFRELAIVFPNVTQLNETFSQAALGEKKNYDILKELLPWKYKLQKLNMNTGYSPFVRLIAKHVFPNLKYLSISPFEKSGEQIKIVALQCLANAPLLTHLRLYYVTLCIEFLEEIHSQCPQLQSLAIGIAIIDTRRNKEFTSVEPNTQMVSFEVENQTIICDHRCLLLDYIVAKYRKLEKLTFSGGFEEDWGSVRIDGIDDAVNTDELDELFVGLEENHDMTRDNYAKNGSRRFSELPPTLKELNVTTKIFNNLPEALETANIQPRTLDLAVCQSLQAIEFFQKWTLLTTAYIRVSSSLNPSIGVVLSNSITTLVLFSSDAFDHHDIYIDRILASFPSLEILNLGHGGVGPHSFITLRADESESFPDIVYEKLSFLFIQCSMVHPTATEFFIQCVPNLKELQLNILLNEESWEYQVAFDLPTPLNTIYLDGVMMEKLDISISAQFESIKNGRNDLSEVLEKGKAYLMVHNDGHVDHYTFWKKFSEHLVDFCLVNNVEEVDIENRIHLLLSHTGTIKEMSIDGNVV